MNERRRKRQRRKDGMDSNIPTGGFRDLFPPFPQDSRP